MRNRKIRNYGSAGWIIRLNQQDIEDLGLEDGDLLDISECVITKTECNKKRDVAKDDKNKPKK